jgi:hypothetical protein
MIKASLAKAGSISLAIVAFSMLLNHLTRAHVFLFLLLPGLAVGLLITGGHGGSQFEESLALVVGFAVNLIVYAILCAVALAILQKRKL